LLKQQRRLGRAVRLAVPGVIVLAVLAVTGSIATAATHRTWWVAAKGGNNANPCTRAHPCASMEHTIVRAKPGDTIFVEKGTYRQDVIIKKAVRVIGLGHPVNNLKGRNGNSFDNGFMLLGQGARGAVVSGFIVEGATFEGILARQTSHVTISNNIVRNNDLGAGTPTATGECMGQGEVPGDCGEGLHLWSVTDSTVTGNVVKNNSGGILLSDENGPTARNLIKGNKVLSNVADCGITIVGHTVNLKNGKPQPKKGGVYANTITGNTVNGNGTKGEGGGILLAAGPPGGAVYNNVIKGNTANGNGLAGITIHNHQVPPGAPAADLNGNKFLNNKLSHNGVADASENEFGKGDFPNTVGILVGSNAGPLKGIVITGNTISNSHFGIYTKSDASKVNPKKNTFHNVKVKVKQH
jgi:parallel beta-helix repeat protein